MNLLTLLPVGGGKFVCVKVWLKGTVAMAPRVDDGGDTAIVGHLIFRVYQALIEPPAHRPGSVSVTVIMKVKLPTWVGVPDSVTSDTLQEEMEMPFGSAPPVIEKWTGGSPPPGMVVV